MPVGRRSRSHLIPPETRCVCPGPVCWNSSERRESGSLRHGGTAPRNCSRLGQERRRSRPLVEELLTPRKRLFAPPTAIGFEWSHTENCWPSQGGLPAASRASSIQTRQQPRNFLDLTRGSSYERRSKAMNEDASQSTVGLPREGDPTWSPTGLHPRPLRNASPRLNSVLRSNPLLTAYPCAWHQGPVNAREGFHGRRLSQSRRVLVLRGSGSIDDH